MISGAGSGGTRKDSGASGLKAGPNGFEGQLPAYQSNLNYQNQLSLYQNVHSRRNGSIPSSTFRDGNSQQTQAGATLQVPSFSRQASYGAPASSIPDDSAFDGDEDDDDNLIEEGRPSTLQPPGLHPSNERRTLYFSGFSDRTTYKDLVSVIKGGQLLSINLRPERSGTVTFLDGAEAFLAWVRRHDIYLHSKRVSLFKLRNQPFIEKGRRKERGTVAKENVELFNLFFSCFLFCLKRIQRPRKKKRERKKKKKKKKGLQPMTKSISPLQNRSKSNGPTGNTA